MTATLDARQLQWKFLGAGYQGNSMAGLASAITIHALLVFLLYLLVPIEQPVTKSDEGTEVDFRRRWVTLTPESPANIKVQSANSISPFARPIPVSELTEIGDDLKNLVGTGSTGTDEIGNAAGVGEGFGDGGGSSSSGNGEEIVDLTKDFKAGVEKLPIAIRQERPEYPELAKRLGIEGTVIVKLLIDKNGKPQKAEIFSGANIALDEAAMLAAMKWLFVPAVMNNNTVAVWVTVPFQFKLLTR